MRLAILRFLAVDALAAPPFRVRKTERTVAVRELAGEDEGYEPPPRHPETPPARERPADQKLDLRA